MTDAFSPDSPDRRHGASSLTARASRPKSSAASTAPAPGSGWWYELRLPIWADVQLPDRITVEPDSVVFRLPARLATPIEDTDYSSVPTRRERPPARPPRSIPHRPGRPVERAHLPAPTSGSGRRVIHHESCWIPTGGADLTLDQVLRELARPGSEACAACEARHLPRS
ncbi:DUF6233 domain-containing protein [Streptomyces asiaticus]|uniref:DUF6233 domain-containing protein n=1 Tax=Streptomyces asiaticus TaxID=114695 RepID=UPI003825C067